MKKFTAPEKKREKAMTKKVICKKCGSHAPYFYPVIGKNARCGECGAEIEGTALSKKGRDKMGKIFIIAVCLSVFISGCIPIGSGKEVCYISGIEDGIIGSAVYTKSDLASSDSDTWCIKKSNQKLKEKLYEFAEKKARVKIEYRRHFLLIFAQSDDEIVKVEEIK